LEVKGFAGLSRVGLSPATMRGLLRRRDGEGAPAAPRDDGVCADCGRSPGRCACDLRFGASACRAAPAGPPAAPRRAASIQRGDSKLRAMEARRHEYEERARAAISPAPRPSSPEPPGAAEPAALDCTPASARWASELVSSFAAGKRDAPPTYRNLLAEVCSPTNQAQADEVNEAIDAIFGGAPPPAAAGASPGVRGALSGSAGASSGSASSGSAGGASLGSASSGSGGALSGSAAGAPDAAAADARAVARPAHARREQHPDGDPVIHPERAILNPRRAVTKASTRHTQSKPPIDRSPCVSSPALCPCDVV
jgi:hypothetical protein